jgi:DNA-binding MarR family transcriptional regulator
VPDDQRDPRIDELVCLALYTTANAILGLYRDLLTPYGITYQQLLVLALLWQAELDEHAPPVTPGAIADELMLDASSVTGLVTRLERAGLVERSTDPADRRRVLVRATKASRDVRDRLGWLEECVTSAVALDPASAHDLVERLHTLRAAVIGFARPTTPAAVPA